MACNHDGPEKEMGPKIFLDQFHFFFFGKVLGRLVCQLGVCIVVEIVVDGTVMIVGDLGDGLVENKIGLVVDTHDFPLKDATILGDYPCLLADVLIPEDLLGLGGLHI